MISIGEKFHNLLLREIYAVRFHFCTNKIFTQKTMLVWYIYHCFHYSEPLGGTNLLLISSCDCHGIVFPSPTKAIEALVAIPVNVTSFRSRVFADQVKLILTSTVTSTVTTTPTGVLTPKTSVTSPVPTSAQKNTIATASNTPLVTTKDPTTPSTTNSTNPKNMSSQNASSDPLTSRIPTTHSVTTDSVTTKEGSQIISTSPDPNITRGISPTLSSSTNLESSQQPSRGPVTLAPGTSEPRGSSPEESNKMTVTTSSGRMTSPTFTAQVTTLSKYCLAFLKQKETFRCLCSVPLFN